MRVELSHHIEVCRLKLRNWWCALEEWEWAFAVGVGMTKVGCNSISNDGKMLSTGRRGSRSTGILVDCEALVLVEL